MEAAHGIARLKGLDNPAQGNALGRYSAEEPIWNDAHRLGVSPFGLGCSFAPSGLKTLAPLYSQGVALGCNTSAFQAADVPASPGQIGCRICESNRVPAL